MKFEKIIILTVSALSCADAFSLSSGTLGRVAKAIERKGEPEMFEDVHLPKDLKFRDRIKSLFEFEKNNSRDVSLFLLPSIANGVDPNLKIPGVLGALDTGIVLNELIGSKKPVDTKEPWPYVLRAAHQKIINRQIKEQMDLPDPCDGYLYFGNKDYTKILPMLCQSSPMFAGALTASKCGKYLELISYSDEPASDSDPRLLAIMRTMLPAPERDVNIRFNKDMTINKITSYETGKAVTVDEDDWNYYASAVAYNVGYFANVHHALLHVYHYYMTAAIIHSTRHDKSLSAWSDPFDDGVTFTYYVIASALFESSIGDNDAEAHTGKNGLGGTPAVMPILRDYLCIWGSCKNQDDFRKKFLLKDLYATAKDPEKLMKEAGILTELNKHFDLAEPYAKELSDAMKADNEKSFNKAETILGDFLSDCGEGLSSIDSIDAWAQSMACTGLIHGSTLGYSRLSVMPEYVRWRNIKAETFDAGDVNVMQSTAAVLVGMTMGRHVFSNEIDYNGMWDTSKISPEVKAVLGKYDSKAEETKLAYQHEIEKRDDFREYGWILTDHCPDGYDGKQHTMTTYI
jgi:hypothetical protein